jgi:hypothetical protein
MGVMSQRRKDQAEVIRLDYDEDPDRWRTARAVVAEYGQGDVHAKWPHGWLRSDSIQCSTSAVALVTLKTQASAGSV